MKGLLQVLSIIVYAFLDLGATVSFATPLVAGKFDVHPDVLIERFSVCTPMDDSVVAHIVYQKYPVMQPNRVTIVDLVELDMFDFDIIWV